MLKKQLSIILVILGLIVCFASCEKKEIGIIECGIDPCEENCRLEPMMGWCGTGAEYKYYFNKDTRQCESYIHEGDIAPFETLQECEDCLCTRLISDEENK